VGFSARYVNAAALKSLGSVPDARVLKAGKEELIKGDDTKALPIVVVCDFQEG
jgi:hypothetical protein